MVDINRLMYLLQYGSENEIEQALVEFIRETKDSKDEDRLRLLRRFFLGLLTEPKAKIKILALKALAKVGLWDNEILETVYELAKNDSRIDVREAAEKALLELLSNVEDRKSALKAVIKAIDKRKIRISPADVVEAVGIEVAKDLHDSDENLNPSEKDLLDFAIKYVQEKFKEKKN